MLRLYTSLKNQRLTMTIFKRSGRNMCHLERKTSDPLEDLKQIFPESLVVRLVSLKLRSALNFHQKQNQFNYHPVLPKNDRVGT